MPTPPGIFGAQAPKGELRDEAECPSADSLSSLSQSFQSGYLRVFLNGPGFLVSRIIETNGFLGLILLSRFGFFIILYLSLLEFYRTPRIHPSSRSTLSMSGRVKSGAQSNSGASCSISSRAPKVIANFLTWTWSLTSSPQTVIRQMDG